MGKINQQLRELQAELKAPKNQRNNFGKYNYRSAEDILEALKPLAIKHKLTFVVYDEIVAVIDRIYVQAIAVCRNDDGEELLVTAFAREEESKKGMDGSQVTGAASSYARKYALNGLLLIDDTKDSDATNTGDTPTMSTGFPLPANQTATIQPQKSTVMDDAVNYLKNLPNKSEKQTAYDQIIAKHGSKLTQKQQEALLKFVRWAG